MRQVGVREMEADRAVPRVERDVKIRRKCIVVVVTDIWKMVCWWLRTMVGG